MNYPPPPPPGQGDPNQPPPQQPPPQQPPPQQPPGGYTPPAAPPPGQPPAYGGQPAYGQPGYGAPVPAGPQTAGKATTSLVLGIVSLVLCGLLLGIPAIFLGISARKEIRDSNGRLGGEGLALGGIITGVIGSLWSIVVIVIVVIGLVAGGSAVKNVYDQVCQSAAADSDPNNDCPS
jgi:hypothetical protein